MEAARDAAGAVGGRAGDEDVDPAERPLEEAGEGQAEGFELAEEDLIGAASHRDNRADPVADEFTPEAEEAETLPPNRYGEADHEQTSEADHEQTS